MRCVVLWMVAGLVGSAGCGDDAPATRPPADLKGRFPDPDALKISLPGQRGPEGSASGAVWKSVDAAVEAQRSLAVLEQYLTLGGEEVRGIAVTVALEGAPRISDQMVRYQRPPSRLDVERVGDHAFFYLQYDQGQGFDPDSAIGESRMLIEGSTLKPARPGLRAVASSASGVSNAKIGYLRFHFNHRPEDADPVRSAAQLDYDLTSPASLNFAYYLLPSAKGEGPAAFWQQRNESGGGLLYASRRDSKGLHYEFLAQYRADGSLAVWNGEGKLWGCYDPAGVELGAEQNPAACEGFKEKFVEPPRNADLWPPLPGGLP